MANKGAFKKGEKRPKQGRPKGYTNKITQDVREMIHGALEDAGGRDYLLEQAKSNPNAFIALIGKIVPKELDIKSDGSMRPMVIEVVGGTRKG